MHGAICGIESSAGPWTPQLSATAVACPRMLWMSTGRRLGTTAAVATAAIAIVVSGANARGHDQSHRVVAYDSRPSLIYRPPSLSLRSSVPLLIALHGRNQSPQQLASSTGLNAVADRNGFVVAYLSSGTRPLWYSAGWQPQDDIDYISSEINDLEKTQDIDPARIFVVGISDGGSMAYRVGCELASKIAGIGVVSGIMGVPDCRPAHQVSVMTILGTADGLIPINGTARIEAPAASLTRWRTFDKCTTNSDQTGTGTVSTQTWSSCANGSAVAYTVIQGGLHLWPSPALGPSSPDSHLDASTALWSVLAAHPMQTAAANLHTIIRSITVQRAGKHSRLDIVLDVGESVSVQEDLMLANRRVASKHVRINKAGRISLTGPRAPKPGSYVLRLVLIDNADGWRRTDTRRVVFPKLST
jgi:polyhydroxybutyrate depolymerase